MIEEKNEERKKDRFDRKRISATEIFIKNVIEYAGI